MLIVLFITGFNLVAAQAPLACKEVDKIVEKIHTHVKNRPKEANQVAAARLAHCLNTQKGAFLCDEKRVTAIYEYYKEEAELTAQALNASRRCREAARKLTGEAAESDATIEKWNKLEKQMREGGATAEWFCASAQSVLFLRHHVVKGKCPDEHSESIIREEIHNNHPPPSSTP